MKTQFFYSITNRGFIGNTTFLNILFAKFNRQLTIVTLFLALVGLSSNSVFAQEHFNVHFNAKDGRQTGKIEGAFSGDSDGNTNLNQRGITLWARYMMPNKKLGWIRTAAFQSDFIAFHRTVQINGKFNMNGRADFLDGFAVKGKEVNINSLSFFTKKATFSNFNGEKLLIHGNHRKTHFHHGANQDIFLRGGTNAGDVFVNDIGGGGLVVGTNKRAANSAVTIDGNVHISEKGGTHKTWNENKYKGYTLWVHGGIVTNRFAMSPNSNWSDFVFNDDYKLKSLKETEQFINKNKHLPHIPSAKEVKEDGYNVHEMNTKLLQTVEELMLHTIAQEKKLEEQALQIKMLTKKVDKVSQH